MVCEGNGMQCEGNGMVCEGIGKVCKVFDVTRGSAGA